MYQERQIGSIMLLICGGIAVYLTLAFIHQWGANPLSITPYMFTVSMLVILILLFYKMDTVVNEDFIVISFGIGAIRKVIPLNDISASRYAKSPWYAGVGIRKKYGVTLYNVQFTDCVELSFKSTDNLIRIGSKNPEQLQDAICRAIRKQ